MRQEEKRVKREKLLQSYNSEVAMLQQHSVIGFEDQRLIIESKKQRRYRRMAVNRQHATNDYSPDDEASS
jgi:hypothetical protein